MNQTKLLITMKDIQRFNVLKDVIGKKLTGSQAAESSLALCQLQKRKQSFRFAATKSRRKINVLMLKRKEDV